MLQIIPSVTRVFRTAKVMYVYLRAYQSGVNVEPVAVYVALFRSGGKGPRNGAVICNRRRD